MFFNRKEFVDPDISTAYYEYLGYESVDKSIEKDGKIVYPILLTFGKNSIDILFNFEGKITKVFSLYIAEGDINQEMLARKIEHYWKMPLWSPSSLGLLQDSAQIRIDASMLSIGYFPLLNGFRAGNKLPRYFIYRSLFREKKLSDSIILYDDRIIFKYLVDSTETIHKKNASTSLECWKYDHSDVNKIISQSIHSSFREFDSAEQSVINFRKIFLDFMFELDNTKTFEDDNFFQLQPVLQNNKLLDAISRKCNYLKQLHLIEDLTINENQHSLPKQFLEAEKSWLKVCFSEDYFSVFNSSNSIFLSAEKEVELVSFNAYIGKHNNTRKNTYMIRKASDSSLRNQLATFYLRKYSLKNAFLTLLSPITILIIFCFSLLIPFIDIFLHTKYPNLVGLYGLVIPVFLLMWFIYYYRRNNINLFKLLLPRMSLGILLGWTTFWSSADLLKGLLLIDKYKLISITFFSAAALFLYIYTDIKNKLIRTSDFDIIKRSLTLIIFAALISFGQGFYIIQFAGETMIQSDYPFLIKDNVLLVCDRSDDSRFLDCQFEIDNINPAILEKKLRQDLSKTYTVEKSTDRLVYLNAILEDSKFYRFIKDNIKHKYITHERVTNNKKKNNTEPTICDIAASELDKFANKPAKLLTGDELKSVRKYNRFILETIYGNAIVPISEVAPDSLGTINILKNKNWLQPNRSGIYSEIPTSVFGTWVGGKIIFLWRILLGQFMISILIGLVLQLLWEDRPITEPL